MEDGVASGRLNGVKQEDSLAVVSLRLLGNFPSCLEGRDRGATSVVPVSIGHPAGLQGYDATGGMGRLDAAPIMVGDVKDLSSCVD